MDWEEVAETRAREILDAHALELYDEAEREAIRLKAGGVSAEYVDRAAFTIRVRRSSSAWGDLLLGVGLALIGLAGGVLAVVLTTPKDAHAKLGWVQPAAIAVACGGFLLTGIGATVKIRAT